MCRNSKVKYNGETRVDVATVNQLSVKSRDCSWRDVRVPPCCLMNRSIGVHRAADKASVGLVRPSATGLDRGHGSLSGFTPLLLCKHTEPSDWTAFPTNQRPPYPLRTIAAGSASARSFIGSSARIFYMNQRASYAFFPWFLCFLRALLQTIKM